MLRRMAPFAEATRFSGPRMAVDWGAEDMEKPLAALRPWRAELPSYVSWQRRRCLTLSNCSDCIGLLHWLIVISFHFFSFMFRSCSTSLSYFSCGGAPGERLPCALPLQDLALPGSSDAHTEQPHTCAVSKGLRGLGSLPGGPRLHARAAGSGGHPT